MRQMPIRQARSPNERTRAARQFDMAERQLDRLVYELYGLTDAEIATVGDRGE